jgi:hypothetical protein
VSSSAAAKAAKKSTLASLSMSVYFSIVFFLRANVSLQRYKVCCWRQDGPEVFLHSIAIFWWLLCVADIALG